MRKFGRCATTIILGILASAAGQVVAQNITPEQRSAYGRQFRASPQERRTLLEAQENRQALPMDIPEKLKQFLESSWSFQALAAEKTPELGYLLIWNEVALQATALDHTNPDQSDPSNPPPYYGEQLGPPRTSRVLAIVHLAILEAVNTISPKYLSYRNVQATILGDLTDQEKLYLASLQGKGEQIARPDERRLRQR